MLNSPFRDLSLMYSSFLLFLFEQSPASRNDFCRMLAQEGLLEPLSTALISVVQDSEDEYAESAKDHILQTFLIYSQSDSWLKKKVATRGVLRSELDLRSSRSALISGLTKVLPLPSILLCFRNVAILPASRTPVFDFDAQGHQESLHVSSHLRRASELQHDRNSYSYSSGSSRGRTWNRDVESDSDGDVQS